MTFVKGCTGMSFIKSSVRCTVTMFCTTRTFTWHCIVNALLEEWIIFFKLIEIEF